MDNSKLQIYIEDALDENEMQQAKKLRLTHYNKFRSDVVYNSRDNAYIYQSRLLKAFEASKGTVRNDYQKAIAVFSDAISARFKNLPTFPVLKNIVQILDFSKWPKTIEELRCYGDTSIVELIEDFTLFLEQNSCEIESIAAEWNILKNRVSLSLDTNSKCVDVCSRVFTTIEIKSKCSNMLHIIELLLITLYSNAKLERTFKAIGRVKTDWRNQMGKDRLEPGLRVSEEGVS